MPFLPFDPALEDDKNKSPLTSTSVTGASGILNTSQAGGSPDTKAPSKSGAYANLSDYLNANKEQSQQMGQQVAQDVSNKGQQASTAINQSADDFKAKADQGTIQNFEQAKQDADVIVGSASNLVGGQSLSEDKAKRWNEVANAHYKGPQDITGSDKYQDAVAGLSKAKEYGSNAQSDSGRYTILTNLFDRPSYSQGQKGLDNALIVGNEQARQSISDAGKALGSLDAQWDKAQLDAAELAKQRRVDLDTARLYSQDKLKTTRRDTAKSVDDYLADQQAHWNDKAQPYIDLLKNYTGGDLSLTQEQAASLGLTDGERLFNALSSTPENLLDIQAFDPNKVVTLEQVARLSALDKLANGFGEAAISKYSDASQAGVLSKDNNFSALRVAPQITQAKRLFDDYARGAAIAGNGSYSVGYGNDWTGRGTADASQTYNANLAQYLASQGYGDGGSTGDTSYNPGYALALPVLPPAISIGGGNSRSDAEAMAQDAANQRAYSNLIANINAALNQQGYNNRVKIAGAPQNLPIKSDGTIDWSAIKAPQGK